jgi:3-hydroxybutyryl-CoA dehydrogenase
MIINEAAATIAEGTASVEDIDKGMMLGTNYPKGPLQWCDEIGAVYIVETLNNLFTYTSDSRYQAHQYLTQLARSGKTFYTSKIKEEAQS